MKITKQDLIEIIKEELGVIFEQEGLRKRAGRGFEEMEAEMADYGEGGVSPPIPTATTGPATVEPKPKQRGPVVKGPDAIKRSKAITDRIKQRKIDRIRKARGR